jgi:hypothetical protein
MTSFTNSNNDGVFQFESMREMVDLGRAEELLATIDSNLNPYHVDLSNKSFSSEAAELIANKLKTYHNIKIANIADIIAGRPEEDALKSLKYIRYQCIFYLYLYLLLISLSIYLMIFIYLY